MQEMSPSRPNRKDETAIKSGGARTIEFSTQRNIEDFDLDRLLPYLINRTGTIVAAAFSDELRSSDITLQMWRVISALHHSGEQRQIDLSTLTSIEESTLSRLVSSMERKSLVSRRRSQRSNREVSVSLTSKGRSLAKKYIPVALSYEDIATEGLSADDLETVRRCLRRMYENLDGWMHTKVPSGGKAASATQRRIS